MLHFKVDKPVLVIGDVMLDYTMEGPVDRISPEAPVPVVRLAEGQFRPGGAANVALGLKALGAKPVLVGLVGHDWAGAQLEAALADRYSHSRLPRYLLADGGRKTTLKTRITSGGRALVRVDDESHLDPRQRVDWAKDLLAFILKEGLLNQASAVVYSDYNKGALDYLPESLRRHLDRLPFLVDPHDWGC